MTANRLRSCFPLEFLSEHTNVVLLGTNGLGKTMIAQNLAHTALSKGIAARFVKASDMLNELVDCDGSRDRRRTLKKWCNYPLLVVDEIGYMNYDARFADLLYEVISGRYQRRSTIVTTNKSFTAWGEVFPNAACVATLVDRLVHNSEAVPIEGESFRAKEAAERSRARALARQKRRKSHEVDEPQLVNQKNPRT